MIGRATALLATIGAMAAIAGCGGGSSSGDPLDDALGYMPKNALVIVAIKTDPNDAQFKNIGKLIDKFPFASSIKDRIKNGITVSGSKVSYEKDVKPLLGNDLVVAVPPGGVTGTSGNQYVVAWQTKGGDAKQLVSKSAHKVGDESGATLYQDTDGSFTAVKDKTIVAAKTRTLLDSALKAREASGKLTASDFNAALGAVGKDGLVRFEGNLQTILAANARAAQALKVPWVKALRTFGGSLSTSSTGIAIDFDVRTSGVTPNQLPLAAGSGAAPVVKRSGEIGVGIREPAQIVRFAEQAAAATDPKSLLAKSKISKQLGVDIDRDVVAQLGGNSAASIALNGQAAARADLKDPASFKKTLAKIMKNLPKARRAQHKPPASISRSGDLYTVTQPGHKPEVLGVVGREFVVASSAGQARELAAQPASSVAGAKGALVFTADPSSLVQAALKKQGNAAAALFILPTLSAHLQSLDGYVESETSGLRGTLRLTIK